MNGQLTPETAHTLLQASQIKDQSAVARRNQQKIEESAHEFEAVFISEMMKPMFEGIETDELFGGGKGEEIFRGMMLQEYGKNIAELDIIGIQTQVKNKLIELQAARTAQNTTEYRAPPATNSKDSDVIDLELIEQITEHEQEKTKI